mmetsp:Transcript_24817/g.28593  ORF Transcript_24817/g.28593 Transcript_24817/m.28593 type:complete len:118 (+) Transcript_24817:721-1074(+)
MEKRRRGPVAWARIICSSRTKLHCAGLPKQQRTHTQTPILFVECVFPIRDANASKHGEEGEYVIHGPHTHIQKERNTQRMSIECIRFCEKLTPLKGTHLYYARTNLTHTPLKNKFVT